MIFLLFHFTGKEKEVRTGCKEKRHTIQTDRPTIIDSLYKVLRMCSICLACNDVMQRRDYVTWFVLRLREWRVVSGKSKRCLPPAGILVKCCDYFCTMTGSACSSSSTGARHPSLLQQQGCRENEDNDKLRRMAIKNSYESRSLCGGPGVSSVVQPDLGLVENASKASTAKILPSLAANKQLYNPHRHSSKCRRPAQKPAQAQSCTSTPTTTRPRSLSAAMRISTTKIHPSTVHDVGASAGDDPRLGAGSKTAPQLVSDTGTHMLADSKGSSKSRSSAHVAGSSELTSVSLSQPNADSSTSSSYIYHIPNRMIQRGRSRSQSRVHAHMHTHNVVPSLSMKRSSSHSTVALHRTGHHHHHHPSPLASIVPSPPTAGIGTPMATSSLTQSVIHPAHVQTTDYHLPEDYHTPHPPHHRPYRQGNAWMGGSLSQDVLDGAGSQVSYCPAAGRHNRVSQCHTL